MVLRFAVNGRRSLEEIRYSLLEKRTFQKLALSNPALERNFQSSANVF